MSRYELMFVISPKVKEADMRPAADQVQKMVTTGGGKIVEELEWGKKKLAYPIKNYRHGFYYVLSFDAEPASVKPLETSLKQNDDLLRYLLLKLEAPVVRALADQKKRAQEHAAEASAESAKSPRQTLPAAQAKSAPATLTPEKPTLPPTKKTSFGEPVAAPQPKSRPVQTTLLPTKPVKAETATAQEKKEKAKLDELDKKLDEILDEDITD